MIQSDRKVPKREPRPVVWQGLHRNDTPNERPLIFYTQEEGEAWVNSYKLGFARLVPLIAATGSTK